MDANFSIGRAAAAAGCKVQTIRYYEQIGILPEPSRSQGNQRVYEKADVDRLIFVRHARQLGFPLQAIRDLLSLTDCPDQSCEAADAIARDQLVEVELRIRRLTALKQELERMIGECTGSTISQCRVIEVLGDHSECISQKH